MVTFDSLEFTVKFDFITIDINRLRGTSFTLHHEVPTYTTNEIESFVKIEANINVVL